MLQCYGRELAKVALHYGICPTQLNQKQIDEYLYFKIKRLPLPSSAQFKFIVYSLRYLYRISGGDFQIKLPQIKRDKRLPVVLSRDEVRRMLESVRSQKHKVLILLLYGCGLRRNEIKN